ncbi:Similar to Trypsin inhibitor (Ascaris suum) [Cotesia congregata]|uniref:Similar to Trypsin inhibitor (Ascaris suum) n=1 Tax=Cotesia congregata TaxID=51543 RepID=A0A8J2MS49_COTCN|nr:Similar to Trypsin inhibitor (Ascaris suum) [Cotesia congregata]
MAKFLLISVVLVAALVVCVNANTSLKCGPNEEIKGCGACDNTCKERNMMCTMDCRPPECGCKKGFYRNDDRKCVSLSQCPIKPKQ